MIDPIHRDFRPIRINHKARTITYRYPAPFLNHNSFPRTIILKEPVKINHCRHQRRGCVVGAGVNFSRENVIYIQGWNKEAMVAYHSVIGTRWSAGRLGGARVRHACLVLDSFIACWGIKHIIEVYYRYHITVVVVPIATIVDCQGRSPIVLFFPMRGTTDASQRLVCCCYPTNTRKARLALKCVSSPNLTTTNEPWK